MIKVHVVAVVILGAALLPWKAATLDDTKLLRGERSATRQHSRNKLENSLNRGHGESLDAQHGNTLRKLPALYTSGDDIIKRFQEMSDKGCAIPFSVGWQGDRSAGSSDKKLFVARIGNPDAQKRVMLVANTHAREAITAEVALSFAQWACQGAAGARDLLGSVQFTVVPVLNLSGRRKIDDGSNPCQRYTADEGEGGMVDLNRNMDVDFDATESAHGPQPFSSYQTRILRDLAVDEKPLAYVDLHSGSNALMVSWGSRRATTPDFPDQYKMLHQVQQKHCNECEIGSNCQVIGYTNPGEIMDHMYVHRRIKYSTLWEVYEGPRAAQCLEYFNPIHANDFNFVVNRWTGALKEMTGYVRDKISLQEHAVGETALLNAPSVLLNITTGYGNVIQEGLTDDPPHRLLTT